MARGVRRSQRHLADRHSAVRGRFRRAHLAVTSDAFGTEHATLRKALSRFQLRLRHRGAPLAGAQANTTALRMPVDGAPIDAALLAMDGWWAARLELKAATVTVTAHLADPAEVRLVTVPDLAPYLAARDEVIAQIARSRRQPPDPPS